MWLFISGDREQGQPVATGLVHLQNVDPRG
jgi:hypothetical protein